MCRSPDAWRPPRQRRRLRRSLRPRLDTSLRQTNAVIVWNTTSKTKQGTAHTTLNSQNKTLRSHVLPRPATRDSLKSATHVQQASALEANWHGARTGGRAPLTLSPRSYPPTPRIPLPAIHIFSTRIFRRLSSCLRNTLGESEIYALIDTYYLGIFLGVRVGCLGS